MIKFITCLFLACGLTAGAAVYSNEFTAFPNPQARAVVTNIVNALAGGGGIPTLNGFGTNITIRTNLFFGSGGISNNSANGTLVISATNPSASFIYIFNNNDALVGINTDNPQVGLDVYNGLIVSNFFKTTIAQFNGAVADYFQLKVKNFNTAAGSSSDLVAEAGHGNETNHYINVGINGPNGGNHPFTNGGNAYVYSQPSNNQPHFLNIGALGSNSAIAFYAGSPKVGASGSVTNPVVRMVIATNGNVGIGTNAPANELHVAGTIAAGTANRVKMSSGGTEIMNLDAGAGTFVQVGSGAITILNNGGNNPYLTLRSGNGSALPRITSATNGVSIAGNGLTAIGTGSLYASNVVLYATTNQVIFGATNLPPASIVAPTKWISVQVAGDAGVYRLPLYE